MTEANQLRVNYLVPVDFAGQLEADIKEDTVSLNYIKETMQEKAPRLSVIILGACRNTPIIKTKRGMGGTGWTRMSSAPGMLIAFATDEGKFANDNPTGNNGLFTSQLLQELGRPGATLSATFDAVAQKVWEASNHDQQPYVLSSMGGSYTLVPASGEPVAVAEFKPPPIVSGPSLKIRDFSIDKNDLATSGIVKFKVDAEDANSSPLTYTWRASNGDLKPQDAEAVLATRGLRSMGMSGPVRVTVTVKNNVGETDSKQLMFELPPTTLSQPPADAATAASVQGTRQRILLALNTRLPGASPEGTLQIRVALEDGIPVVEDVRGALPGLPVMADILASQNCQVVILEQPGPANNWLRLRASLQPIDVGQPLTFTIRYMPATLPNPKGKKR
ncbi:MAG: caspase family protein [Acidobacteriota bacterium]|nr:caspase family protein [Acidobacteriota bacterium]